MKQYSKKQFAKKLNKVYCIDAIKGMKKIPDGIIDLVVTSPPYDNLRDYEGYTFDFKAIANQLFRVIKEGGVVVWVVGDATIKGSETGMSFRQALYFKTIGFNLHDTMIYHRQGKFPQKKRYWQDFEYMFIFSKLLPTIFNPIKENAKNKPGTRLRGTRRLRNGQMVDDTCNRVTKILTGIKDKSNIWSILNRPGNVQDSIATRHPAIFPEALARDHIKSWSNEKDIVMDPLCGSGTTCKMAKLLGRNFIGFDIEKKYVEIARERLKRIPSIKHRLI